MSKRAAKAAETRRRIVDATLELHEAQGIGATSWEEIAARAGVGVGTVYRHFRSLDELVPACGVVTFERLALPDVPEAVFAGLGKREERLRRLVEELFAIYGRGPGAIENARDERAALGHLLDEAHARLEAAFDGLVAAALEGRGDARVARALTDLPVWRTLARRGITGDDAVDVATRALRAALDAEPAAGTA